MLIAYHNDPAVKEKYLERIRAHAAADEIQHGFYWEGGKGCAVGCTVHSASHSAYESQLGVPRVLAKLEDGIFEGMSNGKSKLWPEQFLSAISVGADLSMVWPRFAVWMLIDPKWGVARYAKSDGGKKAIQDVAEGYQAMVDGKPQPEWRTLRAAAAAAAYAAADYAAADYAAAAAARSARTATREAQAAKLIKLLKAAPIHAMAAA